MYEEFDTGKPSGLEASEWKWEQIPGSIHISGIKRSLWEKILNFFGLKSKKQKRIEKLLAAKIEMLKKAIEKNNV